MRHDVFSKMANGFDAGIHELKGSANVGRFDSQQGSQLL
jgi:hypothetical protein